MKNKKIIILVIIAVIMIISGLSLTLITRTNKSKSSNNDYIPNHSNIKSISLSATEAYKQKVIDNLLKYYDENNVNIQKRLEIDTNEIVKSKECKGTVQLKEKNSFYSQEINVECSNDNEESSTEFSSFLFNANIKDPVYLSKANDGYFLMSEINKSTFKDEEGYVSKENDINITKLDDNFNQIWTYDYNGVAYEKSNAILADNELLSASVYDFLEQDDKIFFLISIGSSEGYGNNRLLILNKNGTLYKDYRFENEVIIDHIVQINENTIILSGPEDIYEYNYENNEINVITIDKDNGGYGILEKNNNGYIAISLKNYYEDVDGNSIIEGTNSLHLLSKDMQKIKSINLDEIIGYGNNAYDIDYYEYRMIDNNIYIKYDTVNEAGEWIYPGLLIVDKELNVLKNIKYSTVVSYDDDKNKINEIYDFYVLNNELYLLCNLEGEENYILIDKYNTSDFKLISTIKRETFSNDEFEDSYFFSEPTIINYNQKELINYSIVSKDLEVGEGFDNRVILKLSKVFL